MESVIISVKRQTNTSLSDKKEIDSFLTIKGGSSQINNQVTYRANTNYFIAFRINENITDDSQVLYSYPMIF